uniref:Uncharacterized protein n=1 Tax=Ixodes ricinus TaxID=34613 RepID=A0A6B0UA15_IXORI
MRASYGAVLGLTATSGLSSRERYTTNPLYRQYVIAMKGTAMSPAEMKKGRPGFISRTELNTKLANTFPAIGTRDSQELQKEKTLPCV